MAITFTSPNIGTEHLPSPRIRHGNNIDIMQH